MSTRPPAARKEDSVKDTRAGHRFELAVQRDHALDAFRTPSPMPPRDDHLPCIAAREQERRARRRYQAAIAAAIESLRRAEQRFDESSAAIDVHIRTAVAAVSLTASLIAVSERERRKSEVVAARLATAEVMPP